MRLHAVPDSDAPVTEGAGASPLPLLSGALKDPRAPPGRRAHRDPSPGARCRPPGRIPVVRLGRPGCLRRSARSDTRATGGQPTPPSAASRRPSTCWRPSRSQARCTPDSPGSPGRPRRRTGYSAPKAKDRNGDIDEALTSLLRRYPEHAPYDLIHGLAGIGVYALARWPRPGAAQCILGVLEQLAERARYDRHGVYWWTPPSWLGARQDYYRPGGIDLGVAHGIAGVIPFLGRVASLGLATQTVRPLLDGAVSWLLAHLVDTAAGPTVPKFVADGVELEPTRTAWCYGDPGVAAALLLAARDVGEPAWAAEATALAMGAANRPPDQTGVVDAGLCHGSAGLAHLFNRMYQMTAEPTLADAARFWVERTLELCVRGAHPGRVQRTDAAQAAWKGPGLLEGAAGIVLALEAACTTAEPIWDQMLLVSTTGIPGAQATMSGRGHARPPRRSTIRVLRAAYAPAAVHRGDRVGTRTAGAGRRRGSRCSRRGRGRQPGPATPPTRGHRHHAGIPGRLVRRLTEPGGSGRPVAERPGQRQGPRYRAVARLLPHEGRGQAYSVRAFRRVHDGHHRCPHTPAVRRPEPLPASHPPGHGLPVEPGRGG